MNYSRLIRFVHQLILLLATCRCPGVLDGVPSSRDYVAGFACDLMVKDLSLAAAAASQGEKPDIYSLCGAPLIFELEVPALIPRRKNSQAYCVSNKHVPRGFTLRLSPSLDRCCVNCPLIFTLDQIPLLFTAKVALPMGSAAHQLYQLMSAQGLGHKDFSGLYTTLKKKRND